MNNPRTIEIHLKDGKIIQECDELNNYAEAQLGLVNGTNSCLPNFVMFGDSIVAVAEIELIRLLP